MNTLCKDGLRLGIKGLGSSAARLDLGATTITWKAPSMVFEPHFRLPFPYDYNSLFATSSLPYMISTSSKSNYIGHVYFFVSSYSIIWNVRDNLETTNILSKLANSKFLVQCWEKAKSIRPIHPWHETSWKGAKGYCVRNQ